MGFLYGGVFAVDLGREIVEQARGDEFDVNSKCGHKLLPCERVLLGRAWPVFAACLLRGLASAGRSAAPRQVLKFLGRFPVGADWSIAL